MSDFETIALRAPAGTKTAWVRQARGQKLSAWALAAVARGAALDAGDTLTDAQLIEDEAAKADDDDEADDDDDEADED